MVGRLSVGPLSLHGVVGRFVGWALMLALAHHSGRFGRVSSMSAISAIGTRLGRTNLAEGLFVGLGYFIGGFLFDALYFLLRGRGSFNNKAILFLATFVSGTSAMLPYLSFKLIVLGPQAFMALAPVYLFSTSKGIAFSLLGAYAGLQLIRRLKGLQNYPSVPS